MGSIVARNRGCEQLRTALPRSGATIQSKGRTTGKAGQLETQADVAQLVEQLIRNQQVVSSSLTVGSRFKQKTGRVTAWPLEDERPFLFREIGAPEGGVVKILPQAQGG
jgi:hypothetical protein